jgi:hypothetical protein
MASKTSASRILTVTLGLIGAGAVVGAVCGIVALAIVMSLTAKPRLLLDPTLYAIGGIFGAVTGAIFAPTLSWLLLRRVPLGRAIAHTVVGAVLGGTIGFFLPVLSFGFGAVPGFLWGGLLGATAGAARLRLVSPKQEATLLASGQEPT